MIKFLFVFIYFFSFLTYSQVEFSTSVEKKAVKTINNYFKIKEFDYHAVHAFPSLGLKENHIFKIYHNEKNIGYFAIDQSMGQYDNFDYLVLFDSNLKILTVKLLAYREDYGYEISSKWWLSQFIGKKSGDKMEYKQDIDALSGATISAKSITNSLKILSNNMLYWKDLEMI